MNALNVSWYRAIALGLPMLTFSCSGSNLAKESRTASSSSATQTSNTPGSDASQENYSQGSNAVPISGTNLAEVKVYSECVTGTEATCTSVRFGANLAFASQSPVRFAADTVSSLGVKSWTWAFSNVPVGATCQAEGTAFKYNPVCTASSSLANAQIKASLVLTTTGGFIAKGESSGNGVAGAGSGCGGVSVGGYCWYLGPFTVDCVSTCLSHGGTTAGTLIFAGDQGTNNNCKLVADAVSGGNRTVQDDPDYAGLGCFYNVGGNIYRSTDITFQGYAEAGAARYCSCAN